VNAWLEAARREDQGAFTNLVNHYYAPLFRLVFQMLPCAQDVEEILQDTFFRFYKALGRIREGEDPFPFLRTVAVRRTYTFLKRHRAESAALQDLPDDLADLSVQGFSVSVDSLYRWASGLPAQRRLVFLLREVLGVEDAEIARLLDIREVTVRRHASLAKEQLEKDFGGK
jgi:RNA polymerase sigma-70 factor, ECF subfamily